MDMLNQLEPTSTFDFANQIKALPLAVEVDEITRKGTTEAVTALKKTLSRLVGIR